MTPDKLERRYARHLALPGFTAGHQARLGGKTALVVGLGGLGGHIASLLCAAGIGKLVLVDGDTVSEHNLQRQILYRENQVGLPKAECAKKSLEALNAETEIEIHPVFFHDANALSIAKGCHLIVDGSDNAEARYLMNDVAVGLDIPFVYGSICEYSGQAAVFNADEESATYRCLFPEEGLMPGQGPKGVIAPLPAFVAAVQAEECVKLLCGFEAALKNRLFTCNLQDMDTARMEIPASGEGRKISLERFGNLDR